MKKIGFTKLLVIFLIFSANFAFAVLNDGLVAYYPFNDNANDESGNGYHGTLKPSLENGPTLCEDRNGNPNSAYCFDGVDDYIEVETNDFKNQPFSVVAWIKTNSKGGATIVHYRNINAYYGWGLWPGLIDEQTCLIFGLGGYNTGGKVEAISCNDIYDDVWHFTAGTDDGETLRLYIDGNLVSSEDSATADWDEFMYLYVGAHRPESSDPDDYWYTGAIDDIRIYNRALSEDEIGTLYNEHCEGDFEPDGDVDGSDLAVFAADFGRTDCGTGEPCEGDFDDDNDVDGSDLAVFAADFGRTDCPTCIPSTEICDGIDNDCDGQIDELFLKCGDPLHCPQVEVCNGQDDDCDGLADEDGACGANCVWSPEVCDGCDNNCDGIIDNPPVGGFPGGCAPPIPSPTGPGGCI